VEIIVLRSRLSDSMTSTVGSKLSSLQTARRAEHVALLGHYVRKWVKFPVYCSAGRGHPDACQSDANKRTKRVCNKSPSGGCVCLLTIHSASCVHIIVQSNHVSMEIRTYSWLGF